MFTFSKHLCTSVLPFSWGLQRFQRGKLRQRAKSQHESPYDSRVLSLDSNQPQSALL